MVVVPGFSVTDLIQALAQAKVVYDAFFDEYANSADQVRDLADEIDHFREQAEKHKEVFELRGLKYSGYLAVERTLKSCHRFLQSYKTLLDQSRSDQSRRTSLAGAYHITRYAFDQDEVSRLQRQMERHKGDFMLSLVIENSRLESPMTSPNTSSAPIQIPQQYTTPDPQIHARTPPESPPLTRRLQLLSPRSLSRRQSSTLAAEGSQNSSRGYSPPHSPDLTRTSGRNHFISALVLPEPALPYCVADVILDNRVLPLKRKPVGRDVLNGREMLIVDEAGNTKFRHLIKMASNEACYPYTWHRRWRKDHAPFVIEFKGSSEAHSITLKGDPAINMNSMPKYIFSTVEDFEHFESEIRGKQLEATFDVRRIACATSTRIGEATDQQLKIWRSCRTQEYSLSFYASAARCPRHVEFPIIMLEQQTSVEEESHVRIHFLKSGESKSRLFAKRFSRSSSEGRKSSDASTVSNVFTRRNTECTTATSITSNGSLIPERGSHVEYPITGECLQSQAKTMKWLDLEFCDAEETSRFKQIYENLYPEDVQRSPESIFNWSSNTGHHRSESIMSMSPNGTPLTRSPQLHSRDSQALPEDH